MNYEIWVPTTKAAISKTWGSVVAHFGSTDIGRYCVENDVNHQVTEERRPRIDTFGRTFYYRVAMPDLSDDHVIWFQLKGCLICRDGMAATLSFPEEHFKIRFLPAPAQPYVYFHKPKSPPSK